MSQQARTHYDQAKRFLQVGDDVRAVSLLRRAKLLSEGDVELTRSILKQLISIGLNAGSADEISIWRGQLAAIERTHASSLTPASKTDLSEASGARVRSRPKHRLLAMGAILTVCVAVTAATLYSFGGRSKTAAAPSAPAPSLPSTSVHATHNATPESKPASILPAGLLESRDQQMNDGIGLLLWVQRYEGFADGKSRLFDLVIGNGTGFAVGKAGIMLTNRHVTAAPRELSLPPSFTLPGAVFIKMGKPVLKACFGAPAETHFDATILHESANFDLAIVRVSKEFANPFRLRDAPPAKTERIIAVGFPGVVLEITQASNLEFKEQQSLEFLRSGRLTYLEQYPPDSFSLVATSGIVSSANRNMNGCLMHLFDAKIAGGNSGGPILLEGSDEVIGVVTLGGSTLESSNYNFALAILQLREEIDPYLR